MRWHNKNRGRHPQDPEYIDDYDPEEDYEEYLDEMDDKYQFEKENHEN